MRPTGRRAAPTLAIPSFVVLGVVLLSPLLVGASDQTSQTPQASGSTAERSTVRAAPTPISPHTKIGKRTVEEWRQLVDETWGPGEATGEKIQIFDAAWDNLDREYGAYMNLEVDMRALRRRYRQEIRDGVSRGRFVAIMNHLSLAMNDAHTLIVNGPVSWGIRIQIGTPLFVVGAWVDNSPFGAALTPMPDGSLLVFRALPNHPLGLEPGDLVLGYDWYFSKATGSGYLVDGHQYLAHTGVQVDQEVWLTRDDVAEGRDTVVAAAVRWIEGHRVRRPTRRVRP